VVSYYTDLFTPETWSAFRAHGASVAGFPKRQRNAAEALHPGDVLCCYMTKLSRWCGLLEVSSAVYEDTTPLFTDPDPFVVRLNVNPLLVLDPEQSIPIADPSLWPNLSFTRELAVQVFGWAQFAGMRSSLRRLLPPDADLLMRALREQERNPRLYPLSRREQQLIQRQVRGTERAVLVAVPEDEPAENNEHAAEPPDPIVAEPDVRQSLQVQAQLARIGVDMGFRIWVPRGDRQAILDLLPDPARREVVEQLPLNYDDATLRTIEQIDVIWLERRSMARAFEVEHTTAIYSGLLRMADLLALQPNMNIRVHIVAPDERETKVLREIKRPVFSLLDRGPLYDTCSFLPYSAVEAIANIGHLRHMNDTVLEDFAVFAQEE
jgi:hypothetical protein